MSTHRIHVPDLPSTGDLLITGEEAHHAARVKRLREGERVEIHDGRGGVGVAAIAAIRKHSAEWEMVVRLESRERRPRELPVLHVLAAAPKGERLHDMIDGLSQVGAASWSPLVSERTVVEPREGKLGRLARVAGESMKQCGRAWVLEIGPMVRFDAAMARPRIVVADASGEDYRRTGSEEITLLVGPEGGWSAGEVNGLRDAGALIARFGRHVMRTEVAAVVAAGVVMLAERPEAGVS
ncbi:Ribosomal RNA small subunit methyltransferase E [Phycisphaerales bacterium]|nr:Ribosomal RNA small subunit methyltransferase E [Phycisphaerales bacterium]